MGFPFSKPGEEAPTNAPTPEELKPEALKPEELKPEELKPEALKPEELKPEALKPEELKPEALTNAAPAQAAPTAAVEGVNVPVEKTRKKHNRQATKEIEETDIQYVLQNVRTESYLDMAEKCSLTKFQVNRILMEVKKGLRSDAKGDTEAEAKVEKYISEHLSRPDDAGVGKKGGGKVRTALNSVVSDILGNL